MEADKFNNNSYQEDYNVFIDKLDKLIEDYNSDKLFSDFYNNKLKEFGFSDDEISKIPDSEKLEKLKEEALKDTTGRKWINLHTEYSKILDNPEMLGFITISLKRIQDKQLRNIQDIENEASEIGKILEEKKNLYQGLIDERNKILEENRNVVEEIAKIDSIINGYNKKIENIEDEMKSVDVNSSQYKRLEADLKFYQNRININEERRKTLSDGESKKFNELKEKARTLGYKEYKDKYDALQGKISNLKEQYRENSKKIEERYKALGKDPNEIIKNADFGRSRESKVQEFNSQEINSNITSPTPENPENKENIEENNISNQTIDENQANTPTYNNNQGPAYVDENQTNSTKYNNYHHVINGIEEPANIDKTELVTTDYATRDSIKLAEDYAKIESAEDRSKLLSDSLIFEDLVKTLRDTSKKSRISGLEEKLMEQADSIDIPDDSTSNIEIIKQVMGGGLKSEEIKVLGKMFDKKLGKEYLTGMREYSKDDLKVLTHMMETVTNNNGLSPELKGKFNKTFLQYVQLNSLNIQNGKFSATKFLEKRLPFGRAKAQRDFEEAIFKYTNASIEKTDLSKEENENSFHKDLQEKTNDEEVVFYDYDVHENKSRENDRGISK